MDELRVIDAGSVSALRSQSLWHGVASAMEPGSAPTLSICRPAEPYVGLGFHCALDEVDLDACGALGLPVIRRQIGGGPVYLDSDQLFFQLTLPAERAPVRVDRLYERLLRPAAAAFRRLGLEVRRNGVNDLAVGDRKVSGTGAGLIGAGVTVVGNVLFRFPHERMVRILALPSESLRRECLRLMRRHLSSLADEGLAAVGPREATAALVESYAEALELRPAPAAPTAREEAEIERWEARFRDRTWLAGPARAKPVVRLVKVSSDVRVLATGGFGLWIEASIVGGRFARVTIEADDLNGAAEPMRRALAGRPARPEALRACLEPFGGDGRRVLALLEPGLRLRR